MPTPVNSSGNNQVYGEYARRELTPTELVKKHENKIVNNDDSLKVVEDVLTTEAGQTAMNMADMKVNNEDVISAAKWNAYVAENFPHVTANPVQQYIGIVDAMNSITTYTVQEQAAQKAEEKAALQKESGQDSAPDMGV